MFSDDSLAWVKLNDKYGYIDQTGNYFIIPKFDEVRNFAKNGLAIVKLNGKYGYIDKTGEFVIKPRFFEAWNFAENGLARVRTNEGYGYIDEAGEFVINPQYASAFDFAENGLALVQITNVPSSEGYIDKTGNQAIKQKFEGGAGNFTKCGLAPVRMYDKWGLINSDGEYVAFPQFDDIVGYNSIIYHKKKSNW